MEVLTKTFQTGEELGKFIIENSIKQKEIVFLPDFSGEGGTWALFYYE